MRGFCIILAGLAVIVVGVIGAMAWLGYVGGAVLTDVPANGPRQRFAAVFLSSDMGLRSGMAPAVMQRLAADGVSVVGVNTLTYMRKPGPRQRSPRWSRARKCGRCTSGIPTASS